MGPQSGHIHISCHLCAVYNNRMRNEQIQFIAEKVNQFCEKIDRDIYVYCIFFTRSSNLLQLTSYIINGIYFSIMSIIID